MLLVLSYAAIIMDANADVLDNQHRYALYIYVVRNSPVHIDEMIDECEHHRRYLGHDWMLTLLSTTIMPFLGWIISAGHLPIKFHSQAGVPEVAVRVSLKLHITGLKFFRKRLRLTNPLSDNLRVV